MPHITKEQIQAWLDSDKKNRTRLWLANQCKVAKATVDGWLSAGRPISGPALAIIEELMGLARPLNPTISLVTFLRAKEIADREGISLDRWIENVMNEEIVRARYSGFKVAETPNSYGASKKPKILPDPEDTEATGTEGN